MPRRNSSLVMHGGAWVSELREPGQPAKFTKMRSHHLMCSTWLTPSQWRLLLSPGGQSKRAMIAQTCARIFAPRASRRCTLWIVTFWQRLVSFSASLKTVSTVASLRRPVQHALAPLAPVHTFVCSWHSHRPATMRESNVFQGCTLVVNYLVVH